MADMTMTRPKGRVPRGTLLGGLVALVAFVILVPMILFLAARQAGSIVGAQVEIVVAAQDIPIRANIANSSLTLRSVAVNDVPPQAFTKLADVNGLVAAANIVKGQPITQNLVAKSADQVAEPDLAYLPVPPGSVAITIPASELQAVAGYVRPGDYITVIATVAANQSGQNAASSNSRTVFTNLHVIKVGIVGSAKPTSTNAAGQQVTQTISLSSLTVVMTQCQAEEMNWFLANAQLKYTLESYKDYTPHDQVDQSCPNATAAQGVTRSSIASRYPGIFNP